MNYAKCTIAELDQILRTEAARAKCYAIAELGRRGPSATEAIDPLLRSLNDPAEESIVYNDRDGWGTDYEQWFYVREAAARALFVVAPELMPMARDAMRNVRAHSSHRNAVAVQSDDVYVDFPNEMWVASGGIIPVLVGRHDGSAYRTETGWTDHPDHAIQFEQVADARRWCWANMEGLFLRDWRLFELASAVPLTRTQREAT